MKSLYLRSCVALLCAAGIAACGGNSGSLQLGGTITGLTKDGLVLTDGSNDVSVPANSTSFVFSNLVEPDASFSITIKTQPTGAVCTAANNTGKASIYVTSQVTITCVTNTYALGGTVSGLINSPVVLVNGSDALTVSPGASTFTMPTKVADGSPYGILIKNQPGDTTCVVNNGIGYMGSGPVTSVQVICS